MDPVLLSTISSALVVLATKVGDGTAGAVGESLWNRVKALFGWTETPTQDAIAPRINDHLRANPEQAKQVVQLLQQQGSPVGQLVGSIDADKVIVAQTITGTINM